MTERHQCPECSFVESKEQILTYNVSKENKKRAGLKPMFVGFFMMEGYTGHCAFYIFKCQHCGGLNVDYPHGYTDGGYLYLQCCDCQGYLVLDSKRKYGKIYEREGMSKPLSFFQVLKGIYQACRQDKTKI